MSGTLAGRQDGSLGCGVLHVGCVQQNCWVATWPTVLRGRDAMPLEDAQPLPRPELENPARMHSVTHTRTQILIHRRHLEATDPKDSLKLVVKVCA